MTQLVDSVSLKLVDQLSCCFLENCKKSKECIIFVHSIPIRQNRNNFGLNWIKLINLFSNVIVVVFIIVFKKNNYKYT